MAQLRDQIHGSVSGVHICYAASVKNRGKKTKKKNKDAQHLIAVLPKFFLPFCRPAMAELCCGGQVLLNYQNQSTERENWCSFLMHSGRENQK